MTATPAQADTETGILRLAVLGMMPGNGHPYSWSAIVNGYDSEAMAACPYPAIVRYLNAQPAGSVGIPGAQVTHLWTDDPADAPLVARAARIPWTIDRPEDAIGSVDAVLIATDDGLDHVRRARPFVEAGLPVFVDKPLATSTEDLATFIGWERAGARILSSSGLRYDPELDACLADLPALGGLRWASGVSIKTWERYGIHLLEPLHRLLGPGLESIRLDSRPGLEVAHAIHRCGAHLTIPVIAEAAGCFGSVTLCGTAGQRTFRLADTYTSFRRQLLAFIAFARTGVRPFAFADTVELMATLIAGLRSRKEGARRVAVSEILSHLPS